MSPLFVAISGKKGSGKDELALQIMERLSMDYRLNVEITHFADPLKELCIKLFGLDPKLVYGSNADKEQPTEVKWDGFPIEVRLKYGFKGPIIVATGVNAYVDETRHQIIPRSGRMTHRELLQVMGTDIFRERVYNNIWAELPFKQKWFANEECINDDPADVVFIADCRFPNEAEETLKHKGIVIRVVRNTGHVDNHPSEIALDDYDFNQPNHFIVDNNGSLDDLRIRAKELAILIGGRC